MKFFVRSDLHNFGLTEDGESFTGYMFYVCGEADNGSRFAHYNQFPSVGDDFENISDAAYERAENLLKRIINHISNHKPLDPCYWYEIDPRYGSDKYISMDDLGIFKACEKEVG